MSEKVRLPKDVCDALDFAIERHSALNILNITDKSDWRSPDLICLNDRSNKEIMRALVLGYEPELSAEEKAKELFFDIYSSDNHANKAYRDGIRDALKAHGIHYDWMEDAE